MVLITKGNGGAGNTKDKGYFANEAALLLAYPNTIVDPTTRNGWSAILGSTDTVWIWDANDNRREDSGQKAIISRGQIQGTLSNQTDLQTALNIKADKTFAIAMAAAL